MKTIDYGVVLDLLSQSYGSFVSPRYDFLSSSVELGRIEEVRC